MSDYINNPKPSPELTPIHDNELLTELRGNVGVEVATLDENKTEHKMNWPSNRYDGLAHCEDTSTGMGQNLTTVIRAGDQLFGIITVEHANSFKQRQFVTLFGQEEGDRATIVGGYSAVDPLVIDSQQQPELFGDTTGMSRQHFGVSFGRYGINIKNLEPTNEIEVFLAAREAPQGLSTVSSEDKVAVGGIGQEIKAQQRQRLVETLGLAWAPESRSIQEQWSTQDSSQLGVVKATLENELSDRMSPTHASAVELFHKAEEFITADDKTGTAVVTELIRDGTFHGQPLTPLLGEQAPGNTYEHKLQFLKIYQKDPQAASAIIEKRVAGFHGSSSASLLGVMSHGLLSEAEVRKRSVMIGSGERLFSSEGGQQAISFSTWCEPGTIAQYTNGNGGSQTPSQLREQAKELTESAKANERMFGKDHTFARNEYQGATDRQALADFIENNPDSLEAKLIQENFPVAYGINIDGYTIYETPTDLPQDKAQWPQKTIVSRVYSHVNGEFMVYTSAVTPENMPVIAVPSDKISYVRELLQQHSHNEITVIPLEAIS